MEAREERAYRLVGQLASERSPAHSGSEKCGMLTQKKNICTISAITASLTSISPPKFPTINLVPETYARARRSNE
jgi:hypothetical protein